jgi:hypothetical protein
MPLSVISVLLCFLVGEFASAESNPKMLLTYLYNIGVN